MRQRARPSGLAHLQTHRPARQSPVTEGGVQAQDQHQPCMTQVDKIDSPTLGSPQAFTCFYSAFAHIFLPAHNTAPELSAHPQPVLSARSSRISCSRTTRARRGAPSALPAGTSTPRVGPQNPTLTWTRNSVADSAHTYGGARLCALAPELRRLTCSLVLLQQPARVAVRELAGTVVSKHA